MSETAVFELEMHVQVNSLHTSVHLDDKIGGIRYWSLKEMLEWTVSLGRMSKHR